MFATKKTGKFEGKSNALGHGGRSAQLREKGVSEAVIGEIARKKEAAPGQKNYHGEKKEHEGKREEKHEKKEMKHEPREEKKSEKRKPESLHDYHGHNKLSGK